MAESPIQVDYHEDLKPLEDILKSVKRAGDFFVTGTVEVPMPRVEVAGAGALSFPILGSQIEQLIAQAERAPYGRGAETIIDESVRKVWQLPADKVSLAGKSWPSSFEGILKQVTASLGCDTAAVSAELYKMLIYDAGGFFLAHRDTEKSPGMFGTLVLVLPSWHRGGELIVRHGGREVCVDLSGGEGSEIKFAAFYADCEHEVRPISEGNRVCIIYNLVQQGLAGGEDSIRAPNYDAQITASAELLKAAFTQAGAPVKLAWLLEHQYSPEGLSFAGLKCADSARVKVLTQAAELAQCVAHLGIVHIEQYGSAEPAYYPYTRRRSRWRHYDDDEGAREENNSEDFEIIEVSDASEYVSEWRDSRDNPVAFGDIPLASGELLPRGALDGEKPDRQRLMEASGNEGATFERSYHRAALVVWPREGFAQVLLQAGVAAAMPLLSERVAACKEKDAPASVRQEAISLASLLIQSWKDTPHYPSYGGPKRDDNRHAMLKLLVALADAALIHEFIEEIVAREYEASDNALLARSALILGPECAGTLFSHLIRDHMAVRHEGCAELLQKMASDRQLSGHPDRAASLVPMCEAAVNQLHAIGTKSNDDDAFWKNWGTVEDSSPVKPSLVIDLMDVAARTGAMLLRAKAAKKFAARPEVFDPVTVLVPALKQMGLWDEPASQLWEHAANFILLRSEFPPEPPTDWRQDVHLTCSCPDCRDLEKFTRDPSEQTHRFSLRQDRRQHLENTIQTCGLDITCTTDRTSRPQTLVCAKTAGVMNAGAAITERMWRLSRRFPSWRKKLRPPRNCCKESRRREAARDIPPESLPPRSRLIPTNGFAQQFGGIL